jgi:hypothetical protein
MAKKTPPPATAAAASGSNKDELKLAKRKTARSAAFVSVYSNDVQVQTSPWDLRLTFGELGDLEADPEGNAMLSITQLAEVRLSPQLAKQLARILGEQLASYEDRFGDIPGPSKDTIH